MPAYTMDAFVLRRMHYGETDNILTLFSRERGRFPAIAKGARKAISRLSGATEVLTLTRFGLATGRSLEIVTQVEVLDAHAPLRHDLNRLAHGLYLADLAEHSIEEYAPNPRVYDLLYVGLSLLQTPLPAELVGRWFEVHLLRDLGYAPDFSRCAVCREPLPNGFGTDQQFALSAHHGTALCPRHARPASNDDHSGLSYDALMLLQTLDAPEEEATAVLRTLHVPDPVSMDQTRLALRRSLRQRLERDLKSLQFLDSLRSA